MPAIKTRGNTIYYEERGKGRPVILIHGVGLDHDMWEKQIQYFSRFYKVIAYDMFGHGQSEKITGTCSLSDFVEQLNQLISSIVQEEAHIIGFSMGGMVAQAFAIEYPDKILTLTIMNAVAGRTAEEREAVLARVNDVENKGHTETIEPAINRWFNSGFINNHPQEVQLIRKRLQDNDPISYLKAYKIFATADRDLFDKLYHIKCQTLIMTGEHDVGSTPSMAQKMNSQIPSSEVSIIPNVKHMLPVEKYETVNEKLHSFLRKHSKCFVK